MRARDQAFSADDVARAKELLQMPWHAVLALIPPVAGEPPMAHQAICGRTGKPGVRRKDDGRDGGPPEEAVGT